MGMDPKGYHAQNVNRSIMKKGSKPDTNHAEIREGLRQVLGRYSVLDTKDVGGGFPDLVVGFRGSNYFLEVKKDEKARLTPAQVAFQMTWEGQWDRVNNLDEAMQVIGLI